MLVRYLTINKKLPNILLLLVFFLTACAGEPPPSQLRSETELSVPVPTEAATQQFFNALLTRLTEQTEHAIARQQQIFAFDLPSAAATFLTTQQQQMFALDQTGWASLCSEHDRAACQQLMTKLATAEQDNLIPPVSFVDIGAVTEQVNRVIWQLQKVSAHIKETLYWYKTTGQCKVAAELRETDEFKDVQENCNEKEYQDLLTKHYVIYAAVMLESMARGILPLMLTQAFQDKSGSIAPPIEHSTYHKVFFPVGTFLDMLGRQGRLVEVTRLTVADAIIEVRQSLLDHWLYLQRFSREKKLPSEQEIYRWIAANHLTARGLSLEDQAYADTSKYFTEKFATQNKSQILSTIDIVSQLTSLILVPVLFIPPIKVPVLVISAALNFIDIFIAQGGGTVADRELDQREMGLIIESSNALEDYLNLHRARGELSDEIKVRAAVGILLTTMTAAHIVRFGDERAYIDILASLISVIFADEVLQPDVEPPPSYFWQEVKKWVVTSIASVILWAEKHIPFF